MSADRATVKVTFTQQQMECMEKVRKEGMFGSTMPEVVARVFHEYVRSSLGRGGESK